MSKRPKSELTPVGDLIESSLEGGFLSLARDMVRVFEVWGQAVGEFNAERTKPDSIKNGRLTVLVESPVWIDRFSYFKDDFIRKINESLGAPMVQDILFRAGGLRPKPNVESVGKVARPPLPPAGNSPFLTQVEAAVSGVNDPELREQLARWLTHQNPSK